LKQLLIVFFLFTVFTSIYSPAQDQDPSVGIVEKLGEKIPTDLTVYDENGNSHQLQSLLGKPTVLTLVYYRCPGICSPLLSSLLEVVQHTNLEPVSEYQILTISFDPTETPDLAKQKKENYFRGFNNPFPDEGWRFFSAPAETIDQITKAVGFKYIRQGKDYIHPGVLVILAPDGTISRYLNYDGVRFLPFDFKLALLEAAEGKIGPTINRILLYCFSYDPEGRTYVFNLLQIIGTLTMLFVLSFITWLVISTKNRRKEN